MTLNEADVRADLEAFMQQAVAAYKTEHPKVWETLTPAQRDQLRVIMLEELRDYYDPRSMDAR